MIGVLVLPIVLSALLAAAHFVREGAWMWTVVSLAIPFLLLVRRRWAARVLQVGLFIASLEWLRTLVELVAVRQGLGEPWARLAVVLGVVILFTAGSTSVFLHPFMRRRFFDDS